MFTGLIEEVGKVAQIHKAEDARVLDIECSRILEDVHTDDSICVNGVCLTVERFSDHHFTATAVEETLRKTNLADLNQHSLVNLERAMMANHRFGGHYVQGHTDITTYIKNIYQETKDTLISLEIPENSHKYIVERGSITINGISLTIASIEGNCFNVAIIPHTIENTNLRHIKVGDRVNIEFDIIGKYVENILKHSR